MMRFFLARGTVIDNIKVFDSPPEKLLSSKTLEIMWEGEVIAEFCGSSLLQVLDGLEINPGECVDVMVREIDEGCAIQVIQRNVKCRMSVY